MMAVSINGYTLGNKGCQQKQSPIGVLQNSALKNFAIFTRKHSIAYGVQCILREFSEKHFYRASLHCFYLMFNTISSQKKLTLELTKFLSVMITHYTVQKQLSRGVL